MTNNIKSIPLITCAAVALMDGDKVLIARRPEGKAMAGLWEFPGGKLKHGETPEQALVRELDEELSITVNTDNLEPLTFASHSYEDFHLLMPVYECREWQGDIVAKKHSTIKWIEIGALLEPSYSMPPEYSISPDYPMPLADVPVAEWLKLQCFYENLAELSFERRRFVS